MNSIKQAIWDYCKICSGGDKVETCPDKNCPLYPHRLGDRKAESIPPVKKEGQEGSQVSGEAEEGVKNEP